MNLDGLHHRESHLLQGIKVSFLVIVILAKNLDIRQLIVESMKGTNTPEWRVQLSLDIGGLYLPLGGFYLPLHLDVITSL